TGGNVRGFPMPRTSLGDVDVSVTIDKGLARVDKAQARGGDLDAEADGNVRLRPLWSLSQADLHVRFRPGDRWLNEHGLNKGARENFCFLKKRILPRCFSPPALPLKRF